MLLEAAGGDALVDHHHIAHHPVVVAVREVIDIAPHRHALGVVELSRADAWNTIADHPFEGLGQRIDQQDPMRILIGHDQTPEIINVQVARPDEPELRIIKSLPDLQIRLKPDEPALAVVRHPD